MRKTGTILLTTFLLLVSWVSEAQLLPRYFIYFKDKAATPYSVQKPADYLSERAVARRQRQGIAITAADFPVNPAYIQAVRQTGARVLFTSRWFNAALLEATEAQWAAIKALPFYKSTERNLPLTSTTTPGLARLGARNDKFGTTEAIDYGRMQGQLAMLGLPDLHEKGFRGRGMMIAVFDAGFPRADELTYLKPLFDDKRLVDTYDFVSRKAFVYGNHPHGLNCLSTMAANQPGFLVGAAFEASYALYRTENDFSETPYEEATWVLAAERADSLGVDIISSSLGYNQFDNPAYNYTTRDLDGRTALVSRAALHAARRGILVVASAGNSGNDPWRLVTSPADADSIVSVGAVFANRSIAPFSSVGPTADGRIKPDVAAQGIGTVIGNSVETGGVSSANGTSFSAPLIAGLAAVLWQEFPFLSAQQLLVVLQKSGDQAARPDSLLGYGVPSAQRAEEIVRLGYAPLAVEPGTGLDATLYPNPAYDEVVLDFGKNRVDESSEVLLLDVTGQVLRQLSITDESKVKFSVSTLPAGFYFIRILTPEGSRVWRFLKY